MTTNQVNYWQYKRQQLADAETKRSNLEREKLGIEQLEEAKRANRAKEYETHRSNIVNENITSAFNQAKLQNDLLSINENVRSNLARESETHRSNIAKEKETHRSNVANLLETNRSNVASEGYKTIQFNEQLRSNLRNEDLKLKQIINEYNTTKAGIAANLLTNVGATIARTYVGLKKKGGK